LDVFLSPIVNFTELGSLLLQLDIEKRMLLCEVQRFVSFFGVVDGHLGWMLEPQFWAVLFVMVMMIVVIVVIMMIVMAVALFSHMINNIKMLISHYPAVEIRTGNKGTLYFAD
jgi:hypothetical protein